MIFDRVVIFVIDPRFVGDKVIYSQIDMTRKTSSSSSAALAASGSNKGHNHLTVVHGGSGPAAGGGPGNARGQPTSYSTASTASNHSDPLSWAPLLGNRSGPESSL